MPNTLETVIAQQIHAVTSWFARQREQMLDRDEARRIAEDLGISVDELLHLGSGPETESALMTRMLDLHGLDREVLEAKYGAVLRDMALGCSRCANKAECRHDLDSGAARTTFDAFCSNAETIRSFVESEQG